jgi:hypothetical protein
VSLGRLGLAAWQPFGQPLGSNELIPPALGHEVLAAPRVQLPWRDYLLFRGSLGELARAGHLPLASHYPDWFDPQSPSLLWPQETTWCVATEVCQRRLKVDPLAAVESGPPQSGWSLLLGFLVRPPWCCSGVCSGAPACRRR